MTTVAIVYHSGYGHTAKVAEAVRAGAAGVAGVTAALYPVAEIDAHWDDLDTADALIFGCPTYMGSASAPFKTFMDASSKVWFTQKWKDKLAAGFTNSSSWSGDKLSTLTQLAVFAAQHGMVWVSLGLLPGYNVSNAAPDSLNRIGAYLGAMTQANADQGSDLAPPEADLRTATYLGRRVAELAVRWARGAE